MIVPTPNTTQSIPNLGTIAEPVLLCGGAYSNLGAFEAMLATAAARGISPDRVVHSGDVVAYCADGVATAAALRDSGAYAIKGNVEIQLAEGAMDCGCGFEDGTACAAMSGAWYAHAARTFADQPELVAWMNALPDRIEFTMAGLRFHVLHGAASSINRHLFASSPNAVMEEELAVLGPDIDVVVGGHSGLPFTREVGGRLWHNTGALGMPANDGTPRGWFSILAPEGDGVRFEHVPLDYDHMAAAANMRAAGLPEGYASALETGLWPSLDTLPAEERAQTGRAIARSSHFFAPAATAARDPVSRVQQTL